MFARESTRTERAAPPVLDIAREIGEFVRLRRELGEPVLFSEQDETMLARCAPLALRRMLANLTDNAIRYGGHALLSLSRRDDKVAILVEDEGPGIPPGKAEQVMEPFERLEPSRGRDTGGAGLGLSIVRALAKSQDGALTLENRGGGGLRATLLLQAG
jgi:signal transduction histidine kinase